MGNAGKNMRMPGLVNLVNMGNLGPLLADGLVVTCLPGIIINLSNRINASPVRSAFQLAHYICSYPPMGSTPFLNRFPL